MEDDNKGNEDQINWDMITKVSSALKTSIIEGISAYEDAYKKATEAGLDRHSANVAALKAMHDAQNRIFFERANQASALGDERLASA